MKLQEVRKMINCALESAEKGKHCCQINEDENCPTKKCSVKKTFGKNAENKKHWDETQKNQCEQMKDFIINKDTIESQKKPLYIYSETLEKTKTKA